MLKLLRRLAFYGLTAALVIAGFVFGIKGAANVVSFCTAAFLVMSPFALSEQYLDKQARKPVVAIKWHTEAFFGAVILLLVWQGAMWTASAIVMSMFIMACSKVEALQRRDAHAAAQAKTEGGAA